MPTAHTERIERIRALVRRIVDAGTAGADWKDLTSWDMRTFEVGMKTATDDLTAITVSTHYATSRVGRVTATDEGRRYVGGT